MIDDKISRELLADLVVATQDNDKERIEKAKYAVLTDVTNLFEIVANFIFLDSLGFKFDFGKSIIPKGTKLYRIRQFEDGIDFSDPAQWTAPPSRPQNRANRQGQEALYLGNTENICLLECHIKQGQKYVLATYECTDDIELGGFFELKKGNNKHNIAGIVLNAFLIAPSRAEKNYSLFEYLDNRFGQVNLDNLTDWKNNFDLPLKFAVLNRRNEYYELTNKVCDILQKSYPDGIRYSSCYVPVEMPGISCSDYNVVLYNSGISKIAFLHSEIKENKSAFTDIDIIKIVCDVADKVRRKTL